MEKIGAGFLIAAFWAASGYSWVLKCLHDAGEQGYLRVAVAEKAEDAAVDGGTRAMI